jgi:hypothetical protein
LVVEAEASDDVRRTIAQDEQQAHRPTSAALLHIDQGDSLRPRHVIGMTAASSSPSGFAGRARAHQKAVDDGFWADPRELLLSGRSGVPAWGDRAV